MEQHDHSAFSPLKTRSLLEIAWNRKSLIALGIIVGLTVGVLLYVQATPVYQSKAQVLVVKKRPDNVTGIDTRNLVIEDYVATHKTLIESPTIIDRAIHNGQLNVLHCFADRDELTEFIKKSLTVSRNRSAGATSNVLDLSFRGTHALECPTVLQAIIENYKDFLEETYRSSSDDTLKLVVRDRDALQQDLTKQIAAYDAFRKDTPLVSLRGKGGVNLIQERLSSIELKRSALLVRKAEIQGYLKTLDLGRKTGENRESLLAMVTEWTSRLDGESNRQNERLSVQTQLYPLLQEEQQLLATRGEMHADVLALRKKIEAARRFLSSPAGPWEQAQEKSGVKGAPADPLDMSRDYFTQQLGHIDTAEKLLANLLKEESAAARVLTNYEWKDEAFRLEIERLRKSYDTIIERLQKVSLVKDVGGYDARTIAPPTIGKKVYPSALLFFPSAFVVGGLAGFGLAYLAEMLDKSFRSALEVRQRLGLPVVGQIPCLHPTDIHVQAGDTKKPVAPTLFAYHHPKSVEAEAYRGVRTSLYFNTHGQGHKVVQVTSPNVGDGKSTLAANLAVSIAQSGKKVILIDADMRRPTVHKLFGLSAERGLSSVIVGEAQPHEAIQASSVPGLSILPCGSIPPNPSELLTSLRFEDFLNQLRDQYDFVLVDTPPLLAVTDPSVVAHKVDGVLLNVRFTKNSRPDAERAREILHHLKANVIGVVLNDAEQLLKASGYCYGYAYEQADPQAQE